jgi:hypothetical protein
MTNSTPHWGHFVESPEMCVPHSGQSNSNDSFSFSLDELEPAIEPRLDCYSLVSLPLDYLLLFMWVPLLRNMNWPVLLRSWPPRPPLAGASRI